MEEEKIIKTGLNEKGRTMNYWVITEAGEDWDWGSKLNDCSHRWVAFPATEETLEDVKKVGQLFGKKIYIAEEIGREGGRLILR